jgi:alpha-beta hydrolase superfamily lysophospholipase
MRVIIKTQHETPIHGELHTVTGAKQLLVFCHGFRTSQEHPALQAIAQGLHKKGYDVFTFNFSDETGFNLPHQVADITLIAQHFAAYKKIIVLAGSLGALGAAIATQNEPHITSLVSINGFFGKGQLSGQMRTVYWMFRLLTPIKSQYRNFWRFYKTNFQPERINVPVLVMHSNLDEVVRPSQSQFFFHALAGPKKFIELERSNHELTEGGEITKIIKTIDDWIRRPKK